MLSPEHIDQLAAVSTAILAKLFTSAALMRTTANASSDEIRRGCSKTSDHVQLSSPTRAVASVLRDVPAGDLAAEQMRLVVERSGRPRV